MSYQMTCVEKTPTYPAKKHPERCKLFYCKGCRFYQPWCCGCDDEHADLCDACVEPSEIARKASEGTA